MPRTENKEEILSVLGERLKETREKIPLTQKQVEDDLNPLISRSALTQWETSRYLPNYERLIALANYYDVSIDWLLGVEGSIPEREYSVAQIIRATVLNETAVRNISKDCIMKPYDIDMADEYIPLGDRRKIQEHRKLIAEELLPKRAASVNFLIGKEKSLEVLEEISESMKFLDWFNSLSTECFDFSEDESKNITYQTKSQAIDIDSSKQGIMYIDYLDAARLHFDKAIRLLNEIYSEEVELIDEKIKHNGRVALNRQKALENGEKDDAPEKLIYDEKTDTHYPEHLYKKIYPEESSEQIENNN